MMFERRRFGAGSVLSVIVASVLCAAAVGEAAAQTVDTVIVSKSRRYLQSSPTAVALRPAPCSFDCAYGFSVIVRGANIASITPPHLAGPFNISGLQGWFNNGNMVYNASEGEWRAGVHGDNWSSDTESGRDALFGNGTYTVSLLGTSVSLNLTGNAYPSPPVITMSGGRWLNGKYVVDATKPFTGTTSAYAGYGSHVNDLIELFGQDQLRSNVPGSNTLSVTIPANMLVNGNEYSANAAFAAIVDVKPGGGGLGGSFNQAAYVADTELTIKTEAPVFPITVNANIGATTSSATATIQPRPQDVGVTGSIFVFAHVPASLLGTTVALRRAGAPSVPALPLDPPNPCVLAQINSSGQLVPVSASTMQAAVTGVLGAQGQTVTILNNTATSSVAGAAFYVGYGSDAASMLANGIYQGAVTVPGTSQCSAGKAAQSPGSLTGLYWNANESGWGIHLTQRGASIFAAWYTYDSAGKPKWYVSTCTGASGASGSCSGTLYQVTGPNFFGGQFNPAQVNAANAGTLQISFANSNATSMTYTVGSQTRTVALSRQPLATGTTPAAVDYTDLWWNSDESGWGMAVAQQYGIAFMAWYVYDSTGKPTWYVGTGAMNGSTTTATLYRTTGPAFGPTFDPTQVQAISVGTITVDFTDPNSATLNYTVDGVSNTKAIARQIF
jgi:hypothetical protein